MTVGELDRRMTAAEFAEWLAFASIEPLPAPPHAVEPARLSAGESAGIVGRLFGAKPDAV